MIGRHKDFELFKRTDLYIWHGIRNSTEKKLAVIAMVLAAMMTIFTH